MTSRPSRVFSTTVSIVAFALTVCTQPTSAQTKTPAARPAPPPMTADEIQAFLRLPLVAHLATVRADGSPQVVPMWFLYENGVMYMSTRTAAAKVRHLHHNPHVAVEVDVMDAPLKNKVVAIDGTAEILTTGVKEMTTRIYQKYVGVDAANSPKAQDSINTPRVLLKITPKKMWSMDTTR
jgi:PPOX class probable F420-dependent enzyme